MRKQISCITDRINEPVTIFLENFCNNCCQGIDNKSNLLPHIKWEFSNINPKRTECNVCGGTRSVLNSNGIAMLELIVKYLEKKS